MEPFWSTRAGLDTETLEHLVYQLEELVMLANGLEICHLAVSYFQLAIKGNVSLEISDFSTSEQI